MRSAVLPVLAACSLTAFLSCARANTAHAPHAPFGVAVSPSSTIFNTTIGFNGPVAAFGAGQNLTGTAGAGWTNTSGQVSITFTADPGYVFTGVGMSFGSWSYGNAPFFGGHIHAGSWSIPGGIYVGDINPPETGDTSESWTAAGDSGSFNFSRYVWWDGGGNEFRVFTGPWGTVPVILDNVTSFTVNMTSGISVANESGYGVSSFNVTPSFAAIPEPSTLALGVLLGLGWLVRCRRQASDKPASEQESNKVPAAPAAGPVAVR